KIDERVIIAHEAGAGHRELDAHLVVARFLAGVADRIARIDRTLTLDRTCAGQDRFEQSGLAPLEWPHHANAPWTRRSCAVLCHFRLPICRNAAFCETVSAIVSGRRGIWQEARAPQGRARNPLAYRRRHAARKRPPPSGRPFERSKRCGPFRG